MLTDKQIKKEFKLEASNNPDKYYATAHLKKEGFMRKQCKCGTFFWTVNKNQETCGDPACSGGFRFIGKSPAKVPMDYIETWKKFSAHFKKLGYTPIKRYPVVARWRDDQYWVGASIYDFQPYVVSGAIEPPANPLVVPQFCLRFNDIDNVGITGSHYTGFIMIGQHMFVPKEKWDQNKVFADIHSWLKEGLGLPNEEITFHEDAWAGGGNFGPCMEYFSRGLELGNQVYMLFEQTPDGRRELNLKVLDMGMGHERNAWFSKGTSTSYESTFPTVCQKLYDITKVKVNGELIRKFLPYSSYLNVDEVDDIEKVWEHIGKEIGVSAKELKSTILPLSALYSIADHTRSALFAIADGALPSNVGGGYNLRVIIRRALSFIDKYKWNVTLNEVARWHAEYLEPLFPELRENLLDVHKILDVEKEKYEATKAKSQQMVNSLLHKEDITETKMLELYDSHGISPDMIQETAERLGKSVTIPTDFYSKVAQLHKPAVLIHEKKNSLNLEGVSETEILYYSDFSLTEFQARVAKVLDNKVILEKTAFYPTSGGQAHDVGTLGGIKVTDVFKQGGIVVHVLEKAPDFREGDFVKGDIDKERRLQLAQHHTATHIVNGAARFVLGNHIWQAGANKDIDKARLDITHYDALNEAQIEEIEKVANRIIDENRPVYSEQMKRNLAEAEYGFRIYQGGAVPGKVLRIVKIPDFDVEACGGTHLHVTSEAEKIKILKASKIQDGIVRIEFAAGKAAESYAQKDYGVLQEAAKMLNCKLGEVPGRSQELFDKWKKVVKKGDKAPENFTLTSKQMYDGDSLAKTAEILKTQPQHIVKTISRFMKEIEAKK